MTDMTDGQELAAVPDQNGMLLLSLEDSQGVQADAPPPAPPKPSDILNSLGEFAVYNPPSSAGSSSGKNIATLGANLPDSYFEPSAADLKYAQTTLQARAKALVDAPLQTQKLREEKEADRRKRWPTSKIRVKFANQTILEKSFPSTDKIRSVYAFVRGCLDDDAKAHKFVLFTTPPRRDLKVSDASVRDKSLFSLGLAPSGVLMFRFLDESIPLDGPLSPPPLYPFILSRSIDLPSPPSLDSLSVSSSNSKAPGTILSNMLSKSEAKEKKIPKWFKLGQKK